MEITLTKQNVFNINHLFNTVKYPQILIDGEYVPDPAARVSGKYLYAKDRIEAKLIPIIKQIALDNPTPEKLKIDLAEYNSEIATFEGLHKPKFEALQDKISAEKSDKNKESLTKELMDLMTEIQVGTLGVKETYKETLEAFESFHKATDDTLALEKVTLDLMSIKMDWLPEFAPGGESEILIKLLADCGILIEK